MLSPMPRVISTTPETWQRASAPAASADVVVTFTDRRPLCLAGFVSEAVARQFAAEVRSNPRGFLTMAGNAIPTASVASVEVARGGGGPDDAEVVDMRAC